MTVYTVLGCGKSKAIERGDAPIPIVELYTGNHYRARLRYARQLGGPTWILSALYGLRAPDSFASWYDLTAADVNKDPGHRRDWNEATAAELLRQTEPGDVIVVLAGSEYVKHWRDELVAAGRVVELPLAHMGIGEQLAWLKRHTDPQLDLWSEI